jgi:hypothetical protein
MGLVKRFFVLVFIFLVLSSLVLFTTSFTAVCAVSRPSVPTFSVKFIDTSYDVPPTQTTDPYTGKTTTQPGYHVNDGRIEVTIKNQPFTPSTNEINSLYYYVEVKGHFGGDDDWDTLNTESYTGTGYVIQSGSGYTVMTSFGRPDSGTKLDFRVKAVVGYEQMVPPFWKMNVASESNWSRIQTITITYGSSSSSTPSQSTDSPSASATDSIVPPQQSPGQSYIIIILATVCIIAVPLAIIPHLTKQRKNQFANTTNTNGKTN